MPDPEIPTRDRSGGGLGTRVRTLRTLARLTIREVAQRSGLAGSSISKIENNQLSPTYENIIRLARGLGVDIVELFSDATKQSPRSRRSFTAAGHGRIFRSENYDYEILCADMVAKKMIPMRARVKARSVAEFGDFMRHEGEELLLVLSGCVQLHLEFYTPMTLRAGDCIYFDSTMGHRCLVEGVEDAEVFWVSSTSESLSLEAE